MLSMLSEGVGPGGRTQHMVVSFLQDSIHTEIKIGSKVFMLGLFG